MRVLVFTATKGFQYEVVHVFAQEIVDGFKELGWETELIGVNQPKEILIKETINAIHRGIDFVLHFNGYLCNNINGTNIVYECLKACNIPVGVILVDHPFYHINRIRAFDKSKTFICMYDEGFLYSFEKYIDNLMPIAQLMHGGSYAENVDPEKIYDVVIAGTINKPTDFLEQIDMEEGILKDTLVTIYKRAKNNYTVPVYDYFEEELKKIGVSCNMIKEDANINSFLTKMYLLIDKNLRQSFRYNVLKALLEAGIDVQLYGNCNVKELEVYDNLHIHGAIDYKELLEEMAKSKIVVQDLPAFLNGSHERVLSAMLNKALVLSNINNYCNGEIQDRDSIVYYDVNNLDDLVQQVEFYLKNDIERQKIVNRAYEIVNGKHTWKNRAEELIGIYESFKNIN
ncbi:glycosyltransferase [Aneurinibacillus uraniidurans]|uniref:glycosyltransferase family protein n=1 Tax=Aneurinibacillus uraniidurans TaxID=2966586 RepID=UPI00234A23CA|nr:glycosyltransferase [Aneurinibacillus sp. B1]WCN39196.1 glycosyltransferase [Aneurinibacillus sp. B1]